MGQVDFFLSHFGESRVYQVYRKWHLGGWLVLAITHAYDCEQYDLTLSKSKDPKQLYLVTAPVKIQKRVRNDNWLRRYIFFLL